jgi:hypothetical protein
MSRRSKCRFSRWMGRQLRPEDLALEADHGLSLARLHADGDVGEARQPEGLPRESFEEARQSFRGVETGVAPHAGENADVIEPPRDRVLDRCPQQPRLAVPRRDLQHHATLRKRQITSQRMEDALERLADVIVQQDLPRLRRSLHLVDGSELPHGSVRLPAVGKEELDVLRRSPRVVPRGKGAPGDRRPHAEEQRHARQGEHDRASAGRSCHGAARQGRSGHCQGTITMATA